MIHDTPAASTDGLLIPVDPSNPVRVEAPEDYLSVLDMTGTSLHQQFLSGDIGAYQGTVSALPFLRLQHPFFLAAC